MPHLDLSPSCIWTWCRGAKWWKEKGNTTPVWELLQMTMAWGSMALTLTCSAYRWLDSSTCGVAAVSGCEAVCDRQARAHAVRVGRVPGGGPSLLSFQIWIFSSPTEFCKLTKLSFPNSKIHQNLWDGRLNKKNNFPFGMKFKFQKDFELQIQEVYKIWIWFEFIGASNLWGKI
jgi:hypothetical protein